MKFIATISPTTVFLIIRCNVLQFRPLSSLLTKPNRNPNKTEPFSLLWASRWSYREHGSSTLPIYLSTESNIFLTYGFTQEHARSKRGNHCIRPYPSSIQHKSHEVIHNP